MSISKTKKINNLGTSLKDPRKLTLSPFFIIFIWEISNCPWADLGWPSLNVSKDVKAGWVGESRIISPNCRIRSWSWHIPDCLEDCLLSSATDEYSWTNLFLFITWPYKMLHHYQIVTNICLKNMIGKSKSMNFK